jgi:hypothetical protein
MEEIRARHGASTFGIGEIRTQLGQIIAQDIAYAARCDAIGAFRRIIENCDAPARMVLDHKRCATLSDPVDEIHPAKLAACNGGQKRV